MLLEAFGESKDIDSWINDRRCRVSKELILRRIRLGWSVERALSTTQKAVRLINFRTDRRESLPMHQTTRIASWQIKDFRDIEKKHGIWRFRVLLINGGLAPGGDDRLRQEQIDAHAQVRLNQRIRELRLT